MDSHWNAAGHELGAVTLTRFLLDTGLITPLEPAETTETDESAEP